ncbi:MAG: MFS transporter [Candidatus Rokuibacteriota bacterium]|nr:MAG: MFS transporter [Candidatus Rokubacteria bacterium]
MADSKPAALRTAVATEFLPVAERVKPHTKLIALLALGHFVIDVNQGALPAVLPFLKHVHTLSYAQAAMIVLAANVASSIIQPLFGYLSDQIARRWLLPLSVFVSGLGIALLGLAPGYAAVVALVIVLGLGAAAWHPEGYKTASSVAGDRKATALSWFSLGGNVGIAVGPPLMIFLVAGLAGDGFRPAHTLGMLGPTLVVGTLLLAVLPRLTRESAAPPAAARAGDSGLNMPRAMALLILVVTMRAWSSLGFSTFVPFYYLDTLKADPRLVGVVLFVFLGAGALGTVVAGPIADRVGARTFMQWVLLAAIPFGALFLVSSGPLAFVALGLFGAALTSSFSVSVVLGQAYLPRNAGMASGLIVGFAIGLGGAGVTALGWIADRWGVPTALWISALMPLAGFALTRFLPAPRGHAAA